MRWEIIPFTCTAFTLQLCSTAAYKFWNWVPYTMLMDCILQSPCFKSHFCALSELKGKEKWIIHFHIFHFLHKICISNLQKSKLARASVLKFKTVELMEDVLLKTHFLLLSNVWRNLIILMWSVARIQVNVRETFTILHSAIVFIWNMSSETLQ